jgi:hypothetical protein
VLLRKHLISSSSIVALCLSTEPLPGNDKRYNVKYYKPHVVIWIISKALKLTSCRMWCNIICCYNISIARQRVNKQVHAEVNARKNRTSIAKQWSCKHASLTTEDGVFRGVCAEEFSWRQSALQVQCSAAECTRTRMEHVLSELWRLAEYRLGQRFTQWLKTK